MATYKKNTFDKNPLSRNNTIPRPPGLTEDQDLVLALKEGLVLIENEEKIQGTPSVSSVKSVSADVQNALAKMSDNPYMRGRTQVLDKMTPSARSVIERMEQNKIPKDHRWDIFCREVAALGDKLSNLN